MTPKSTSKAKKSGQAQPQPGPEIIVSQAPDNQQHQHVTPLGQEQKQDTYEGICKMLGFVQDLTESARHVSLSFDPETVPDHLIFPVV